MIVVYINRTKIREIKKITEKNYTTTYFLVIRDNFDGNGQLSQDNM